MPISRARDIARTIGRAVIADTISSTGTISSSASFTVYDSAGALPSSGVDAGSQAYVSSNQRLYIRGSGGWYSIATVNNTPVISSIVDSNGDSSPFDLAIDGTATTITITATDSEGFPITYTATADSDFNGLASVTSDSSVFTITPFSEDSATTTSGIITFKASDGVNIASELTTFTLTFSIVNSNYTTLLVKAEGNSGTNTSITDSSSNSHTVTVNGNTQATSFSPYRRGGYSYYFDGNGDYLQYAANNSTVVNWHSQSTTMEAWIYLNSSVNHLNAYPFIFSNGEEPGAGANTNYWGFGPEGATPYLKFKYYNSATQTVTSSTQFPLHEWVHVALVHNSGTIKLYQNGIEVASASVSGTPQNSSSLGLVTGGAANGVYNGYIRDARLVHSAVYTAEFTPPTEPLTAITNTQVLLCHLPYIVDGSTNGHSITIGGNVSAEPFTPFDYISYTTNNHGGSVYFDGTGDYLTVDHEALGTGDWTIEGWVYFNSISSQYIFDFRSANNTNPALAIASDWRYITDGDYRITSGVTPSANIWYHFAIVKNSGTTTLFVDGTSIGTYSDSLNYAGNASGTIGKWHNGSSTYLNGYLTNLRIVKGTAVYTSDFTPPTSPLTAITNTSVLISGTDAKVYDASQTAGTLTLNGNAASSTTQTKNASSSVAFDGSGDSILVDDGDNIANFGSDDFTIEFWLRLSDSGNSTPIGWRTAGGASSTNWLIQYNSGLDFFASNGSSYFINALGGQTLSTGQWYHIAVTRSGSTFTMWIDGSSAGTATSSSAISSTSRPLYIGYDPASGTNALNGYIEDVRITKGLAHYTSSFTPPTSPLKG